MGWFVKSGKDESVNPSVSLRVVFYVTRLHCDVRGVSQTWSSTRGRSSTIQPHGQSHHLHSQELRQPDHPALPQRTAGTVPVTLLMIPWRFTSCELWKNATVHKDMLWNPILCECVSGYNPFSTIHCCLPLSIDTTSELNSVFSGFKCIC